jgi:hypothetical protein
VCWRPLEVSWVQVEKRRGTVMATVLIRVCYGGGVRTWAGWFVIWGGFGSLFELFLLQSCVSHPISQHLSECMVFLVIPCRPVWVQTSCCDFECLVFDRNKSLMMMMAAVLIRVSFGGGARMWSWGFIIWGEFGRLFEFFFLQSWVQTLCCDFECLVFDRNKYLMMMMRRSTV